MGYYIDTQWRPLAVHFDGVQWSRVPVPSNLGTFNAPDSLPDNIDDNNLGLSRLRQEGDPQWRFVIQPELQQTQAQMKQA